MTYKSFEELTAWQKARKLVNEIYDATEDKLFSKDFCLRDHLRKSSISILSNIAEGFERGGTAEFMQFLWIAKGSAGELRSQLFIAFDQKYINSDKFRALTDLTKETASIIAGLITYLKKSNLKGIKYK